MSTLISKRRMHGGAIAETVVALLVFVPFLIGVPLLGKQMDVKHKSIDAARYSAWERTVWRDQGDSNVKSADDISIEAADRAMGDRRAGLISTPELQARGITENVLWADHAGRRLMDYEEDTPVRNQHTMAGSPEEVGRALVPAIARGESLGVLGSVTEILGWTHLGLRDRTFAGSTVQIALRPVLQERARRRVSFGVRQESAEDIDPILQTARSAILSDSWGSSNEGEFQTRVTNLTFDEVVGFIELPTEAFGALAVGTGGPPFGEAQWAANRNFRPRSNDIPRDYVAPDED
jgi:hypothetical protein